MRVDPSLPGAELVVKGLADLEAARMTPEALVILIAAPRLVRLGMAFPQPPIGRDAELELYELLVRSGSPDPFSTYNGLLRRIDSFAAALEAARGRAGRGGGPGPG